MRHYAIVAIITSNFTYFNDLTLVLKIASEKYILLLKLYSI